VGSVGFGTVFGSWSSVGGGKHGEYNISDDGDEVGRETVVANNNITKLVGGDERSIVWRANLFFNIFFANDLAGELGTDESNLFVREEDMVGENASGKFGKNVDFVDGGGFIFQFGDSTFNVC